MVTPQVTQRLLTIKEASHRSSMGRTTLYDEAKAGRLRLVKIGAATRIEVAELDRWIDERIAEGVAA